MSVLTRSLGILAVILAAVLWSTTGTAQSFLPEGREPLIVASVRLIFGAGALMLLALASRDSRRAFGRLPLRLILFSGMAVAAYNLLFFVAVTKAGVGVGTAIAIGSAPIWVTLHEILIRRIWPDRLRALGQGISIFGVGLLVASGSALGGATLGAAMAAAAGMAYAAYSLLTSRMIQTVPAATLAASTFSTAAVLTLPVFFLVPTGWLGAPGVWPVLLFLGVAATGLSYALYTWGLARVSASTAVTLALAEPLSAWVLASTVVGESITPAKLAGAVMIVLGLAIVTLTPARKA